MGELGVPLLDGKLGEAEHEDFGAGILELDGGFGINACAFNGLYHTSAKSVVKDYLSYGKG